jgi:hypothetical protein
MIVIKVGTKCTEEFPRIFAVAEWTTGRCRYLLTTLTCDDNKRRHERDGMAHRSPFARFAVMPDHL